MADISSSLWVRSDGFGHDVQITRASNKNRSLPTWSSVDILDIKKAPSPYLCELSCCGYYPSVQLKL